MKNIALITLLALTITTTSFAQEASTYKLDASHSEIAFEVTHLGFSTVRGKFDQTEASINLNKEDLSQTSVSVEIQTASINTENAKRDGHLRSGDFFLAEEHPTITFISTGVSDVDGKKFKLHGNLTMRGVTNAVVLDAVYRGSVMMRGNELISIKANGSVLRKDYGISFGAVMETGGLVVSNEVDIIINIEAVKM